MRIFPIVVNSLLILILEIHKRSHLAQPFNKISNFCYCLDIVKKLHVLLQCEI